jgi:hypothetical protein
MLLNLPLLISNLNNLASWVDFAILLVSSNVGYLVYARVVWGVKIECFDFCSRTLVALLIYVAVFSSAEKIKKEQYVLVSTNAKTKKQVLKVFDQAGPQIIVSKDGIIQLFNQQFEHLVQNRLSSPQIPSNILKFL